MNEMRKINFENERIYHQLGRIRPTYSRESFRDHENRVCITLVIPNRWIVEIDLGLQEKVRATRSLIKNPPQDQMKEYMHFLFTTPIHVILHTFKFFVVRQVRTANTQEKKPAERVRQIELVVDWLYPER